MELNNFIFSAGKRGKDRNGHLPGGSEEDYDTNDSGSVYSVQSEVNSQDGGTRWTQYLKFLNMLL